MSADRNIGLDDHKNGFFARVSDTQWKFVSEKYQLTPRELQVLKLWMLGMKQCAVAQKLGIKTSTVRAHVSNINARVGVRNRFKLGEKFFDDIGQISSRI